MGEQRNLRRKRLGGMCCEVGFPSPQGTKWDVFKEEKKGLLRRQIAKVEKPIL